MCFCVLNFSLYTLLDVHTKMIYRINKSLFLLMGTLMLLWLAKSSFQITFQIICFISLAAIFNAKYDENYKFARKTTMQGMRMLLNTKLQGILDQNIDGVERSLSLNGENPVNLEGHVRNIVLNSMLSLLLGTQYQHDDEGIKMVANLYSSIKMYYHRPLPGILSYSIINIV